MNEVLNNQTYGEWKIGLTFNPSGDEKVMRIKKAAAALIDELYVNIPEVFGHLTGEQADLLNYAINLVKDASMNGVMAVTKRPWNGEN